MHPDPYAFFQYRLACLEQYFAKPLVLGVYDVAAWMRQLLLDATPLMDVVNREVRVRIRFEVNTLSASTTSALREKHGVVYLGASLSPQITRMSTTTRHLTREQFLQEPVLLTGWERISVKEMILWAANEAGGVHYDPRHDGTTTVLNRLMRAYDSRVNPVLGSTIIGIARVVRDGLEPLSAAIDPSDV
jgi:hypothetical protein